MSTVAPVLDSNFITEATICSILPREDGQDHTVILRTHGAYFIKHPQPGEAYKLSHVTHKVDYADVGEYDPAKVKRTGVDPRKQFHFDAKQIAEDICKSINDNGAGTGSFFGVFVCKGMEPTEAELEHAHEVLQRYFMQNIEAADAQWSSNPKHELISGVAKRAARYMQLDPEDHEWMSSYQKTVACPGCGERVRPNVAVCKSCGAILNKQKYAELFPAEAQHQVEAPRRSPGRPKKEPATV